ncbi:hypothetical protein [Citrobacter koseri]|uniref:hypothetical protein n=1 Tax=Citrobacter koseri TaxID=545 RepID=UPI00397D95DB
MQGLKLTVMTSVFSLAIGTAVAAPTTELPKVPDNQAKEGVSESVVTLSTEAGANIPATKGTGAMIPDTSMVSSKKGNSSEAAEQANEVVDAGTQIVQERLAGIVEDNYAYEKARRQLESELELEKLRSQIRKLRGEDKMRPPSVLTEPKAPVQQAAAVAIPRVVLEADIAGSQRVAVSDGNALRYVRAGEIFSMGGNNFKLAKDKKSVILVGDAVQ